ncbi:MAG: hypothetical protein KatS3mg057_2751 [Herpetosiphonaceae bacterium]|nr:MAG: hypothetical protein KatS3mg057_2751 [Herpetosiphonaceae bacterium]
MPHILIVDPDSSAAQITAAGIARGLPEATVLVVPGPAEGWEEIQRQLPDALIIDPVPYSLSAATLIRQLKTRQPHSYIVVLASTPTPALQRELRSLQIDAYLEKPAPLSMLVTRLCNTFAGNGQMPASAPDSDSKAS